MDESPATSLRHPHLYRQFLALMEEQGRTMTSMDLALLETFLDSEEHFSAGDLARATARGKGISPSTEEAAELLQTLCEYRVAHEVLVRGESRYEHFHLQSHHDHFICVRCGAVQNFSAPALESLQDQFAREASFRPLTHRLEIFGVCRECLSHEAQTRSLSDCLAGERVRVVRVVASQEMRQRLHDMGIVAGTELKILGDRDGDLILVLRGSRIALSGDLCRKISVTTCTEPENVAMPASGEKADLPTSGRRGRWLRWRGNRPWKRLKKEAT